MSEKTEQFVATQPLFVGNARAVNPGDLVDAETVANNGWQDGVAKEGTKDAVLAQGGEWPVPKDEAKS